MRRWNLWLSLCLVLAINVVPHALHAEDDEEDPNAKPALKEPRKRTAEETYELYKAFADTLDQIERNYVKEVDRRELMEAAIRGMVSKLDPYSNFIPSDDFGSFKSSVESQFGGLGIQVTVDDGQLRVLSPIVGTPAYRAGIQAGDRITEIEGESTRGLRIDEAVRKLKGEAGTSVTITVYHPGTKETEKVTLKREVVRVSTVLGDTHKDDDSWEFMLDNDSKLGYIRMTSFSRETTEELKKALDELKSRKMRGLILDLRNNPGGLLTAAIDISDLFVADGKIVSTQGRNTPERVWEAKKDGKYEDFPLAVLVNRYSASASEILAACLQDHQRAVIIGERTWGKGSVQNVIELEDGKSALKLTTASYQRPNGHNIHRFPDSKETDEWGVKPNDNYEVKLSDSEFTKLLDQRRRRDHLAPKTNPKEEDKEEVVADPQLEKAVKYLSSELARVDEPKQEEDQKGEVKKDEAPKEKEQK
jgi:carboxyl-terminal processing protease